VRNAAHPPSLLRTGPHRRALEQDLGVPIVQPIAARIWEIQWRLHVRQPVKGYGTLPETLPA
jgi:maleate cis-trans isomerase